MNLDRAPFADGIDLLVRLALDVDLPSVESEHRGHIRDDLVFSRSDLRPFEDDGCVHIGDRIPLLAKQFESPGKKLARVTPSVGGVMVRKQLPDIGEGQGTEQGISDGVEQGVGVGVSDRTSVELEQHSPDQERQASALRRQGLKAVKVVPVPDAQSLRPLASGRVRVDLPMFRHDQSLPIRWTVNAVRSRGVCSIESRSRS